MSSNGWYVCEAQLFDIPGRSYQSRARGRRIHAATAAAYGPVSARAQTSRIIPTQTKPRYTRSMRANGPAVRSFVARVNLGRQTSCAGGGVIRTVDINAHPGDR